MGNSNSKIDILLATYNGSKYIDEQIRSIIMQTHTDWHLLISDDCSSDGTLEKVNGYARTDPRIEVVSSGVRYGSAKLNFINLLNSSTAPYAMFCDQDDVWLPNKVDTLFSAMKHLESEHGAETPLLVFSDMKVVDSCLNLISESFVSYSKYDPYRISFCQLLAQNIAAGCSMILNKPLIDVVIMISDQSEGIMMHDWFAMIAASAFGQIGYINKPLNLYRQHGDNEVGARRFSILSSLYSAYNNKTLRLVQFYNSLVQADVFCSIYGGFVDKSLLKHAVTYALIAKSSSALRRVTYLVKSGCWKRGLRKVGQLYDAIMIGNLIRGK